MSASPRESFLKVELRTPERPSRLSTSVSTFLPTASLGSPTFTTGVDEAAFSLQQRLSQELAERDAAKVLLQKIKSGVEYHRQRLQALLLRPSSIGSSSPKGEDPVIARRARDVVREMEAEVRAAFCDGAGSGVPLTQASPSRVRSYEVLRHSLKETQRQSDSMNREMVTQAEVNAGLIEVLGTVKDANKRLLEQLKDQTTEIAELTQLRVADEELQAELTRRHDADHETVRRDTQRQVAAVQEAADDEYCQVHKRLSAQLRSAREAGQLMMGDVTRLRRDAEERQNEILSVVLLLQEQVAQVEAMILKRLGLTLQAHRVAQARLQQSVGLAKGQLVAETEERQASNLTWALKHGALDTDKGDLEARMQRECAQLSGQLQAMDRRRHEERQAYGEERARLERELAQLQQQRDSTRATLDGLQRDVVTAETVVSAALVEVQRLQEVVDELLLRARESDDVLAAAVSSNQHLRAQIEEQSVRLQEKNAEDLNGCRSQLEKRMQEERQTLEAETSLARQQAEVMAADVRRCDEELGRLEGQSQATLQEVHSFEAEIGKRRSQMEGLNSSREDVERSFNEERHEYQAERLRLQALIERLTGQQASLEEELSQLSGELHERRRCATAREVEDSTHLACAESRFKELQEQLHSSRSRLREAVDRRHRHAEEALTARSRALEAQASLERRLEDQVEELEEQRARLESLVDTERHKHAQARADFEREKMLASDLLRRVQDENRSKLAGAERERARIEETCRTDLAQGVEFTSQQQRRFSTLDQELVKVRGLLADNQSTMDFITQERQKEERESNQLLGHLQDEVRELATNLDRARREEISLGRQAEAQRLRNDQERRELRRALEDVAYSAHLPLPPARELYGSPRSVEKGEARTPLFSEPQARSPTVRGSPLR